MENNFFENREEEVNYYIFLFLGVKEIFFLKKKFIKNFLKIKESYGKIKYLQKNK